MNWFARYARWLHTRWPAGHVEPLPETDEQGRTNIPGVYIVGDLKGIPLLKFSVDSGTKAVRLIAEDIRRQEIGVRNTLTIPGSWLAGLRTRMPISYFLTPIS